MPPQAQSARLIRYASAGMQFILPFAALTLLGIWLDRRWGTLPGYTILLAIGGFAAGVWNLRRLVRAWREQEGAGRDGKDEDGG